MLELYQPVETTEWQSTQQSAGRTEYVIIYIHERVSLILLKFVDRSEVDVFMKTYPPPVQPR